MTNPRREAAERFAAALRRTLGAGVKAVTLFGSVATGVDSEDSDVDILVVVAKRDLALLDATYALADDLSRSLGIDLSVKVMDEATFDAGKGTSFLEHVDREGVALG